MFTCYKESENVVAFVLYMCESYYYSYNFSVDLDKRKQINAVPFGQPQVRGSWLCHNVVFNINVNQIYTDLTLLREKD